MGIAIGDEDRDGDFDLYVTNITAPGTHNILLRRHGKGDSAKYEEVSAHVGVSEGGWGWGTTFLDADRDGWLDIAATNGWDSPNFEDDPSRFYWNRRPDQPGYDDVSGGVLFDDTEWGSALVAFDVERDGDPDLVQVCMLGGPLRVLLNQPSDPDAETGRWLLVRPRMLLGANPRAIGAVVRIEHDGVQQIRLITAGISYLGQEPAEALFGLGTSEVIDRVTVEWPDGRVTVVEGVVADGVLDVNDGGGARMPGSGAAIIRRLRGMLGIWSGS